MVAILRPKKFLLLLMIPFVALLGVLLNIMIFKGSYYTNMAVNQRVYEMEPGRNVICDKNMIPFTKESPRYDETSLATHLVGYASADGKGVTGVEKAFDKYLLKDNGANLVLKDGSGKKIPNFKVNDKGEKEQYLKLTLDYHIQKIAENVLDSHKMPGAVVVMDVETFDVCAMVSRPQFDRNQVEKYTEYGDTELVNRAISPYNAGSIFKIVTASALIEEGLEDRANLFLCSGGQMLDGLFFTCHKKEGHGVLSLHDALVQSCNCAFYDAGTVLGSEKICEYGKKFGIGEIVLKDGLNDNCGNMPMYLSSSKAESANLAIGQGEIMITPLQAAKIACIIASGGVSREVNVADCVITENGKIKRNLRKFGKNRVISEETAKKVGAMMFDTVNFGTGTNAKSHKVSIAGKTGSAETGWQTEEGYMVQGWFVGFFPYENPKYSIAVMCENGRQGNKTCAPIFKEIAEKKCEIKK